MEKNKEMIAQHNEMWDAYQKLNEKIEDKQKPKFKDGDIIYQSDTSAVYESLRIYKSDSQTYAIYLVHNGFLHIGIETNNLSSHAILATEKQRELLFGKLAERGERWNAEKMCIEDLPKWKVGDWFVPHKPKTDMLNLMWQPFMDKYNNIPCRVEQISEPGNLLSHFYFHPDWCEKIEAPKHKEPIIGEMAIFWDSEKRRARIAVFGKTIVGDFTFVDNKGESFANAILFESVEQYKNFIK